MPTYLPIYQTTYLPTMPTYLATYQTTYLPTMPTYLDPPWSLVTALTIQ